MRESQETIFHDLSLNMVAHPLTGNVKTVKNTDAIKQAVKMIVLHNFYEKPYNPTFGGNILAMLFDNMTDMTTFMIQKNIALALQNYEPRILLLDVRVRAATDLNTLGVTVVFKPINEIETQTVNVILERVR